MAALGIFSLDHKMLIISLLGHISYPVCPKFHEPFLSCYVDVSQRGNDISGRKCLCFHDLVL